MADGRPDETEFTEFAWDVLYDTVDSERFLNQDAEEIYNVLQKKINCRSFGEYLRRYIYKKGDLRKPFGEIGLKEYQDIIRDSFRENNTPASFEPTTSKLSTLSKNWLTQQTVKRKVVFLLGFGLGMSVEDVNMFLQKALREQGINAKDPFEVICWYCYKFGYGYFRFQKLWKDYLEIPYGAENHRFLLNSDTQARRIAMEAIHEDDKLLSFVVELKTPDNLPGLSVSARQAFDELFVRTKELAAGFLNQVEESVRAMEIMRYESDLLNNERIAAYDRIRRVAKKREEIKKLTPDEVTEYDLEKIISSAIPKDQSGNLKAIKNSSLNGQFEGKRFNRQHISDILRGKSEVTRFDLITLNFFIFSQTMDDYPDRLAFFSAFIASTNQVLTKCYWGELNISNPYECFVLMCILSVDPLETYAEVWEMSYQNDPEAIGETDV